MDPVRRCVYLTEDQKDGCFYRFLPGTWPELAAGRLEVLCGERGGPLRWERFAHLAGHRGSEIAGPAFSPDGSRLYFSSQRGTTARESDGCTFEITGPFHHL